jgi:hypothetical protein
LEGKHPSAPWCHRGKSDGFQIGGEGIKAVAAALPASRITCLSLGSNNIGDEGVKVLAAALRGSSVTYLGLAMNNIGVEGIKALAAAALPAGAADCPGAPSSIST